MVTWQTFLARARKLIASCTGAAAEVPGDGGRTQLQTVAKGVMYSGGCTLTRSPSIARQTEDRSC